MTQDRSADGVSRRKFLIGTGAAGAAALAGCSSDDSNSGSTPKSDGVSALDSGGSSTVYPIARKAAAYWSGNRPASDEEYWPAADYGIDTDKNLADYWAGLYGFEPRDDGKAPFKITVGLSHSGTGVRKVRDGLYDIGNASGNVEDELPERDSYEKFKDHVVGVDGQPIVVSSEIKDAGLEKITGQQLKDLYKGRISNWQEIDSSLPDKSVRVLGRAKDSGTRTSFVNNVWGSNVNTQVATRYGQNQRLATAIQQADNAISYLALAFLDTDGVSPIALEWEGTTYEYGADSNGLDATEYPLSRNLHMYTWEGTSKKESAYINMILSDFGQETFVEPNNYFMLSKSRREKQRSKLAEQTA